MRIASWQGDRWHGELCLIFLPPSDSKLRMKQSQAKAFQRKQSNPYIHIISSQHRKRGERKCPPERREILQSSETKAELMPRDTSP